MVVGMVRWGFETRDNEHSGELATCFHFVTVIVIDIPTRRYTSTNIIHRRCSLVDQTP